MPTVQLNGTTLFYREVGKGLPCVALHGGLGLDHVYMKALDPLGDTLRLFYLDLRGNGRSGRPSVDTLTFASFCADVDALRAKLGFERWAVLGHSYGGFIALEYALRYPERVSHLILADTSASMGDYTGEIQANVERRNPTPEVLAALAEDPADDESFARMFETIGPLYYKTYDADRARKLVAGTIFSAAAANRGGALIEEGFNVTARLGEIKAPTLILVGREDFITPPSRADILHAGIPGSDLDIFEQSGHFPFVEESDAFFAAVRGWVRRHHKSSRRAGLRRFFRRRHE